MKTSWRRLRQIEDLLSHKMSPDLLEKFRQELLEGDNLRTDIKGQQHAYRLIRNYGQKQMRKEISGLDHYLFEDKLNRDFQQQIRQIFT